MRDFRRHPEPTAHDLGELCLRAVAHDRRFDDKVRRQARHLLLIAQGDTPAGGEAAETASPTRASAALTG